MWSAQTALFPGRVHAPTLCTLGDTLEGWAESTLKAVTADRLVVVGCSVGGSCALEVAALAPDRVAALVLIGTKARHRPDPAQRDAALEILRRDGPERTWTEFWAPLFSPDTDRAVVSAARDMMLSQPIEDIERGVRVFHSRQSRDDVLASFQGPLAVVTGACDVAPGADVSAAQARLASQGVLHVVPRCGHYVPLERPEALNTILREVVGSLR